MSSISPSFSPLQSSIGGILIGTSAITLFRLNGRILGASGILSDLGSSSWRKSFIGGMLMSSGLFSLVRGPELWYGMLTTSRFSILTVVSGVLVGFGTAIGSGCTSGHGICGLSRFSKRSLVAVLTFFPIGMITAHLCSKIDPLILHSISVSSSIALPPKIASLVAILLGGFLIQKSSDDKKTKESEQETEYSLLMNAVTGAIFSIGLIQGGMVDPRKVLGFLDLLSPAGWDPSLPFVMGFGLLIGRYGFRNYKSVTPVLRRSATLPTKTDLTLSLVLGSTLFGIGWGICGVCPGPGVVALSSGTLFSVGWMISFQIGAYLASFWPYKK